ncbi:hypothetical protein [Nonomuraea sp. NPDC023979]|uniref:hypothetical protein n=1 Tax=Nonomuraea sp. NPDC023979 TaxID=3154796 RepID=UPI0033E2A42B
MHNNPHLTADVVLLAVRREGVRPEPPVSWALVSDTGQGWHLERKAKDLLAGQGYALDDYTLYAVDQQVYEPRDVEQLRIGRRNDDIVHMAFGVEAHTIDAVRAAAGRWRQG